MTAQEQIFAYKELRNNGQVFVVDNYEDADRIIEALDKQIPKKPTHCYSGCVEMWKCPTCCKDIMRKQYQTMTDGRKDNFCQNCGQKLDWGE